MPAPTGPDLRLTAICGPGLPFNGHYPQGLRIRRLGPHSMSTLYGIATKLPQTDSHLYQTRCITPFYCLFLWGPTWWNP